MGEKIGVILDKELHIRVLDNELPEINRRLKRITSNIN